MRRIIITIVVTLVCIYLLGIPSVANASYNTPVVHQASTVRASPPWDTGISLEQWSVIWEAFPSQLYPILALNTLRHDIPNTIQSEAFKTNWITETFSLPLSNHDLFKAPDHFSTTDWTTRWVDQKVSDIERQYETDLANEYTENLLQHDLVKAAKYQLQVGALIFAPSWTGAAALISDITSDFGPHDMGQIASNVGDCLSVNSIAFGDPFSKFTTVASRFLDNLALRPINQPLQIDGRHPLDWNDGFTSINGWSEVNMTFTPSYPSSWEGTWTRQIQNQYTVSTGLNSNWSTYGGISANSMFR